MIKRLTLRFEEILKMIYLKKITVWELYNKKDRIWEHNHIEDGWSRGNRTPKKSFLATSWHGAWFPEQEKNWKNKSWRKTFKFLIDGKVETIGI